MRYKLHKVPVYKQLNEYKAIITFYCYFGLFLIGTCFHFFPPDDVVNLIYPLLSYDYYNSIDFFTKSYISGSIIN